MKKLMIYTKVGCPYCAAAKKHYAEQGIEFDEIDVNNTPGAREKALALTGGQNTVPIIVGDGPLKIGFGGG